MSSAMKAMNPIQYAAHWASEKIRDRFTRFVPVLQKRGGGMQGYAGGGNRRADMDWDPIVIGPNSLADQFLEKLWARCRWLADSHPLITGARDTVVANTCGKEIYPIPATRWPELNKQLTDIMWAAAEGVDASRKLRLVDSQALFNAETFTTGEVLASIAIAPEFRGFKAGPVIELFPCEQLGLGVASPPVAFEGMNKSHTVRQGVEFDEYKRERGYWIYKALPNDNDIAAPLLGLSSHSLRRLDARDAVLAFKAQRIGQIRGIPPMVSALMAARDQSQYAEANLALAKVLACIGVYFTNITTNPLNLAKGGTSVPTDADGRPIQELFPGMIGYLPNGVEPKLLNANVPGPNFPVVIELLERQMGAGLGLSYGTITKDRSKTTFSASRAEQLDDRKIYEPRQMFTWHFHTRPWYRRLVQWAIITRQAKLTTEQRVVWETDPDQLLMAHVMRPGWDWVNPQQEAQATETAIRTGVLDRQMACAARGEHWQDVVERQLEVEAYEMNRRRALGLPERAPDAQSGGTSPQQQIDPETGDEIDPDAPTPDQAPDQENQS